MKLTLVAAAVLTTVLMPLAAEARTVRPAPYAGVVEGFYGTPWEHSARVSMIRWIARHGMNAYVYAPKEDAYHRALWREQYPAVRILEFRQLVAVARANRVRFVYGISPGLDMCYSAAAERSALTAKLDQIAALGVTEFMLALDDIPPAFHCDADTTAFGPGLAGLGRAHASLGNYVRSWLRSRSARGRLMLVPTHYEIRGSTAYLATLAPALHRSVDIVWTGPDVVSARISVADADRAARILHRPPLLWDNYPVNDFARGDLHLGPIVGRAPGLPRHMAGFLANPMEEAESSKVALFTLARYLRSPRAYRPLHAWRAGLAELAGSRVAARLLERFAESSLSTSTLNDPDRIRAADSPVLWRRMFDAGRALRTPNWQAPLGALEHDLERQTELPERLPAVIANRQLLAEIAPWLEKVRANAVAGLAAVSAIQSALPQLIDVRVRRRGRVFWVTGRLLQPTADGVRRSQATLDVAWANAYQLRKETHGTAIPFLVAMARARTTCKPGATVLRLNGRRITLAADGRFRARALRPRSLRAVNASGDVTSVRLGPFSRASQPRLSTGDRRARAQIARRVARFANAVRTENVREIGRIFDPGYGALGGETYADVVAAWASVFRESSIERVRFRLEAFDAGDRLCGGPVVASVPWTASGRLPSSVPFVEGGGGRQSMGERAVFLFVNRATAARPDWRIIWGTSASTNRF
jgi:hypothetical protein